MNRGTGDAHARMTDRILLGGKPPAEPCSCDQSIDLQRVVRELESRLLSKENAMAILVKQRDHLQAEVENLKALLDERDRFPPMLGGWYR